MSTQTLSGKFAYPNRMGRIILASMRQELQAERLAEVLAMAGLSYLAAHPPPGNLERRFPFESVSALQAATEQVFGVKAGRQLNYRIGRGTLGLGLKEFDPLLGIADLPMRLVPLGMKFRVGLDVFARVFNQFSDQVVRLSEDDRHLLWIIERCPVCWSRHVDKPVCYAAVGLLQEGLRWVSGGKEFRVDEVTCRAAGDPHCTFACYKEPIG